MRISLSTGLLGGVGYFGRIVIALVILLVLKTFNKNDKELDRGLRLLVVFGIMGAILLAVTFVVMAFVWSGIFGHSFGMFPFGFSYYYH